MCDPRHKIATCSVGSLALSGALGRVITSLWGVNGSQGASGAREGYLSVNHATLKPAQIRHAFTYLLAGCRTLSYTCVIVLPAHSITIQNPLGAIALIRGKGLKSKSQKRCTDLRLDDENRHTHS